MLSGVPVAASRQAASAEDAVWRALANPLRRRLLDELSRGARTTGELASATPGLSRFAVMQHLAVLTDAGLVVMRRRGRHRFNYLNAAPLRQWYDRWVTPLAESAAVEVLALHRHLGVTNEGEAVPESSAESVRTVRVENELRFRCSAKRLFEALTTNTLEWFPHTYGGERTRAITLEPRVGGLHYEDWGDGRGHLYGHVTAWDPPRRFTTRGRLHAGTILDASYVLEEEGGDTVLKASKVAFGPITDEEAAGIKLYGDLSPVQEALRKVVER